MMVDTHPRKRQSQELGRSNGRNTSKFDNTAAAFVLIEFALMTSNARSMVRRLKL